MRRRLTCGVKYFCLGACLIFIGTVLLCVLGFAIVLPYEATSHWPEVTCYVINNSYTTRMCSCENQLRDEDGIGGCFEAYPCLQIIVSYQANISHDEAMNLPTKVFNGIKLRLTDNSLNNDVSYHNANLESPDDDNMPRDFFNQTIIGKLYRSWEDAYHKTCTLHECGDEHWNLKQVDTFEKRWGIPGASFPCYYDPDDVIQAVLERTSWSKMINALLWPTLFLVTGLLIWMGLWVGCWEVDMENYSQSGIDHTTGGISGRSLLS